jgi:hypothetical protein
MAENKDPKLFDFIKQVLSKNRTHPYDKKVASAYMLTQWLSHKKEFVQICNNINKYQFLLPDDVIYEYYMKRIPKGTKYVKWIKKRKADDKMKERIEKLQLHYPNLSTRECKMIISNLLRRNKK